MRRGVRYQHCGSLIIDYADWNSSGGMASAPTGSGVGAATPSTSAAPGGSSTLTGMGTLKWAGGVLASNGYVYAFPAGAYSASSTLRYLKISPSNVATLVGPTTLTTGQHSNIKGGIYHAATNKLFSVGGGSSSINIFDVATETIQSLTYGSFSLGQMGVLGQDGLLYFLRGVDYGSSAPQRVYVTIVDPVTLTVTTNLVVSTGVNGGVATDYFILHPSGNIYGFSSNRVLIYTPSTGALQSIALTGIVAASGLAIVPDGRIFIAPASTTTDVIIFDPATNTCSSLSIAAYRSNTGSTFGGISLGANGNLFMPPKLQNDLLEINPTTLAVYKHYAGYVDGSNNATAVRKFWGTVQRDDNSLVSIPSEGTRAMTILMGGVSPPTGWHRSSYVMNL